MKAMKHVLTLSAAVLFAGITGVNPPNGFSAPAQNRAGIVDANGDGICDITGRVIGSGAQAGKQAGIGKGKGPGNGTGNRGNGPADGTGYGSQSGKRNGPQNGTQARIRQGNGSCNGNQFMGTRGGRGGRR